MRRVWLMAAGHFVIDSSPALLFALMPLFIARLHMSYALAGLLTTSMLMMSSVGQPAFGYLNDRFPLLPLSAAGLVVSGLAMGLTGLAASYPAMLGLVLLSGLGSACFHPQAVSQAGRASRSASGFSIAIFFTGGSAGTGAMSLVIVPLVSLLGMPATLFVIVPAMAAAGLFLRARRRWLVDAGSSAAVARTSGSLRLLAWPLGLLLAISILRSAVLSGYLTFLPSLVTGSGGSLGLAALALAVFLFSGSAGALAGGIAARRAGSEVVTAASLALALAALLPVPWLGGGLQVGWMGLAGVLLFASEAQVTASAQRLLPALPGVASSLMMGVGLGLGNLGAFATGAGADRVGLVPALLALTLLLLGAVAAALGFIPVQRRAVARSEAA